MSGYPYADIAARFGANVARHNLTILKDDGLYRHLRFARPDSSVYWFDLITWPGTLAIRGDMDGGYMFSRLSDMFEFFRGDRINDDYWAEKLEGGRRSVEVYSEELFRQLVNEHFVEAVRDGLAPAGLGKAVRLHLIDNESICNEADAHHALASFQFKNFRFVDSWEWSFREYDQWFIYACHAIQWGIAQYDAARVAVAS